MIQCVGSRDEERPYCSRICCVEAVKNALKIKELWPSTNVYTLYRDMRTYGLKEGYYTKARQKGVVFMRYGEEAKPEVMRDGSRLVVRVFEKTVGETLEIPADLVVLSTGVVPSEGNKDVSQHFKIPLTKEGFFLEAHMKLRPVDFATDGVFLCGLAHAPKLIEESIVQAEAAAARAGIILAKDKIELEATRSQVIDENCDGCAYCVEPCPFQAITLLEYVWQEATKKTVEVNESLCKGCGTCMATCPKRGVIVRGFSLAQLEAQVEAALEALVEG
jgi:heterodisulfide reductase subunit A